MNTLKKRQISNDAEMQLLFSLINRVDKWISSGDFFRKFVLPGLRELSKLTPFVEDMFELYYLEYYYGLR